LDLKLLLKRGALLAAANWPVLAIQFVAETTLQVLLAVPIIGAAVLLAVLLGADLAELLQQGLREIFTTVASTLMSEPIALVAFITAFAVVLLGGSVLLFLVKGGTVDVILAAHRACGPIEREALTYGSIKSASTFTLQRYIAGCRRLFHRFLVLGLDLMAVCCICCCRLRWPSKTSVCWRRAVPWAASSAPSSANSPASSSSWWVS
jgi:hypothetical protein